jgi:protein tyrosine/serine phosphatase
MRLLLVRTLLLSTLFTTGCATVGQNHDGLTNFDQVSPALYRGAQPTSQGIATLAAMHVKTIINLRDDASTSEPRLVRAAGMNYLALPLNAATLTGADAQRFLTLLGDAPPPVFVHCFAGRDRTGMAIAAYRIRIDHWQTAAALAELYAHGHNWLLFPKVRSAIAAFAQNATPPAASH